MNKQQYKEKIDDSDIMSSLNSFNSDDINHEEIFLKKPTKAQKQVQIEEVPSSTEQIQLREFDTEFISKMCRDIPIFHKWWNYINKNYTVETRQDWLDLIESQHIAGNESKEALFVLNHCLPFALNEARDLLNVLNDEVSRNFKISLLEQGQEVSNILDKIDGRYFGLVREVENVLDMASNIIEKTEQLSDTIIKSTEDHLKSASASAIKSFELERERMMSESELKLNREIKIIVEQAKLEQAQLRNAIFTVLKDEIAKNVEKIINDKIDSVIDKYKWKFVSLVFGSMISAGIVLKIIF